MRTIEFEADIQNNTIHVPADFQNLNQAHVRVIILKPNSSENANFNPKDFFGLGQLSKKACDAYLADVREGWE